MPDLGHTYILHLIIPLFFGLLVLMLFVRVILSWLPLPPNPVTRFTITITAPLIDPIQKRIPSMALGMFDISTMVAFIFSWWLLQVMSGIIMSAIPAGW